MKENQDFASPISAQTITPPDEKQEPEITDEQEVSSSKLTLQNFFNDMDDLGRQVNDPNIKKPTFHYGDASVTNYLLWLILGELMILNDEGNI